MTRRPHRGNELGYIRSYSSYYKLSTPFVSLCISVNFLAFCATLTVCSTPPYLLCSYRYIMVIATRAHRNSNFSSTRFASALCSRLPFQLFYLGSKNRPNFSLFSLACLHTLLARARPFLLLLRQTIGFTLYWTTIPKISVAVRLFSIYSHTFSALIVGNRGCSCDCGRPRSNYPINSLDSLAHLCSRRNFWPACGYRRSFLRLSSRRGS